MPDTIDNCILYIGVVYCMTADRETVKLMDAPTEYSAAQQERFLQHDDPDVIIPDRLALPLLVSSHLLLVTSIVSIVYGRYVLSAVVFFVYVTSVLHWREPRFSSWFRILDYIAVATSVGYGCYVATTLQRPYELAWFIGLSCVVAPIFITNETFYYIQVMKDPTGKNTIHLDNDQSTKDHTDTVSSASITIEDGEVPCCSYQPTKPFTEHREWVYKRTMLVHLICVHVFANALALTLVIGSAQ